MKFIADSMVGTLVKWLRAMGYDVAYDPFLPDRLLMRHAREEGRILLTRDTRMIMVKDVPPYVFISHDKLEEQIAQVMGELNLIPEEDKFLTRCIECNGLLEASAREDIKQKVPPYVYAGQRSFLICPGCGRIYWSGTHLPNLRDKLLGLIAFAKNRKGSGG
jgi:hypothetical protein